MPTETSTSKSRIILLILLAVVVVLVVFFYFNKKNEGIVSQNTKNDTAVETLDNADSNSDDDTVKGKIEKKPLMDYQSMKKEGELKDLMQSRKDNLGIDKSLDMIVKSDEKFKVGDNEVSMQEILKQAHTQKGTVYQEKIEDSGAVVPKNINRYGIYVVQPNDNIWNIHFNFLKEFYAKKDINLSPKADEPLNGGVSSGVGKILKFSEKMVMIYNLNEKKVSSNLNLIEPMSKVVIYNMDEVFSLLSDVNYENIDRLQFDGKSIWIPATK